jgi:hypothetical protein
LDALKAKSADLKRIYLAGTGNESHFWSPRWTTSRVQGLPSIGISGREPGRILKRLWSPAEGSRPYARTIVLTSATLSTPGFKESSMWRSIEIATGADPSSGLMLTDLATTIEPHQFGRLRVRFADPRAPVPRFDDDGNIAPDALEYSIAVITAAMECSARDKGRTLVLVPSYADADSLRARLPAAIAHKQGVPLQKMLETYRATPGCCLITPGAWVGADLPGLIQNLVIPRVPFPPPGPGLESNGARMMSDTLIKLAQGIGRAIRSDTDDVVLWFADPRIPIPESVTDETGLLPSPKAISVLLGAIPKRFRDSFGREPDAAGIAVPFIAQKRGETRATASTTRSQPAAKKNTILKKNVAGKKR